MRRQDPGHQIADGDPFCSAGVESRNSQQPRFGHIGRGKIVTITLQKLERQHGVVQIVVVGISVQAFPPADPRPVVRRGGILFMNIKLSTQGGIMAKWRRQGTADGR